MIDSSPRRLEMTSPCTNTWSPRSTSSFHCASDSSPTFASEIIAWIRDPSPACRVAKQSLPVLRLNTTRPATPTSDAGLRARLEVAVLGAQLRDRVRDRHRDRERPAGRVRALGDQPLALGQTHGLLLEDLLRVGP